MTVSPVNEYKFNVILGAKAATYYIELTPNLILVR